MSSDVHFIPNPDLVAPEGHLVRWAEARHRRRGWHHLHEIARYGLSFRSGRVLQLESRSDLGIALRDDVRTYTNLPWFSAMLVLRGRDILFERYAPDFGPARLHSVQSISKTLMHMLCGQLWSRGRLDLDAPVEQYLPEIGSGYRGATVQQVLNMDVVNDYSEDFTDPGSSYFVHEEAMGWRLPAAEGKETTQRPFLCSIASADVVNHSGTVQYKDANSDVLAWICERASGQPLRLLLADLVDAAGLEHGFHITADREGVPGVDGGLCLTARDLARYLSLLVRDGGRGEQERAVSRDFLERSLACGPSMAAPFEDFRYCNHLMIRGRTVGHGGWGGQFALVDLETRVVAVFLSVLENAFATNTDYLGPVADMLADIARRAGS